MVESRRRADRPPVVRDRSKALGPGIHRPEGTGLAREDGRDGRGGRRRSRRRRAGRLDVVIVGQHHRLVRRRRCPCLLLRLRLCRSIHARSPLGGLLGGPSAPQSLPFGLLCQQLFHLLDRILLGHVASLRLIGPQEVVLLQGERVGVGHNGRFSSHGIRRRRGAQAEELGIPCLLQLGLRRRVGRPHPLIVALQVRFNEAVRRQVHLGPLPAQILGNLGRLRDGRVEAEDLVVLGIRMDAGPELRLLLLLESIVPAIVRVVRLEILEDPRLHRLADVVHHGRAAFQDAPHAVMRCGHPRERGRLVDHPVGTSGSAGLCYVLCLFSKRQATSDKH
mmetsp:Transcript_7901/g.21952  ORF Transcript_7901/g.21952 Transcript_7901/m.21952 type:complete len:335 (-) Transcript_7901:124-1128(-)